MSLSTVEAWRGALLRAAAPALAGTPLDPAREGRAGGPIGSEAVAWAAEFADEYGHRRVIDQYLLGRLLGLPVGAPPEGTRGDVVLWCALASGGGDAGVLVAPGGGPLFPGLEGESVEVWTEAELAGLHALWAWPTARARARSHARWLMDTLQPDNGTNHPWGVHVFVLLAEESGWKDHDARLYAETLLHNCVVSTGGRADRFSALILLDAARSLDRVA